MATCSRFKGSKERGELVVLYVCDERIRTEQQLTGETEGQPQLLGTPLGNSVDESQHDPCIVLIFHVYYCVPCCQPQLCRACVCNWQ